MTFDEAITLIGSATDGASADRDALEIIRMDLPENGQRLMGFLDRKERPSILRTYARSVLANGKEKADSEISAFFYMNLTRFDERIMKENARKVPDTQPNQPAQKRNSVGITRPFISRQIHDTSEQEPRFLLSRLNGVYKELVADDALVSELLERGFRLYVQGDYESALARFQAVVRRKPDAEEHLFTYLEICQRCVDLGIHADDRRVHSQERNLKLQALRSHRLARAFLGPKKDLRRCKYCARYVPYINPERPTAGMSVGNQCVRCDRSYPMPAYLWDSVLGQAYSYYRHSMFEEAFYQEFEQRFSFASESDMVRP